MSRSASREVRVLDPSDATPQVLFTRETPHKVEAYIIRFRTLDLALDAVRHNERVPQFETMRHPVCVPFICAHGTVRAASRFINSQPTTEDQS